MRCGRLTTKHKQRPLLAVCALGAPASVRPTYSASKFRRNCRLRHGSSLRVRISLLSTTKAELHQDTLGGSDGGRGTVLRRPSLNSRVCDCCRSGTGCAICSEPRRPSFIRRQCATKRPSLIGICCDCRSGGTGRAFHSGP